MKQRYSKNQLPNTKDKRRRRMPRAFTQRIKQQTNGKTTFKTCPNEWEDLLDENCELINIQLKKKNIVKKPVMNYIQSLNYGVPDHFIFTLYGMITIDQKVLKQQSKDQSLINSIFNFYSLVQVEVQSNYLFLKIQRNKQNLFPIPYFIQRFRNLGDSYFYQLADKIAEIDNIMSQFKSISNSNSISDEQLCGHLQKMKGKAFLLRVVPNKLFFSKELIQISGCTISQIANQCLKFKSFISEFFNADNYREQIDKFFQFFGLRMQLMRGQIDPNQYVQRMIQKPVQYITNKDEGVVKILTNKYNLAPGVGCWEIQKIIGKEKINPLKRQKSSKTKHRFYEEKKWDQLQKMKKLFAIVEKRQISSQTKTCSYKQIQTRA